MAEYSGQDDGVRRDNLHSRCGLWRDGAFGWLDSDNGRKTVICLSIGFLMGLATRLLIEQLPGVQ